MKIKHIDENGWLWDYISVKINGELHLKLVRICKVDKTIGNFAQKLIDNIKKKDKGITYNLK